MVRKLFLELFLLLLAFALLWFLITKLSLAPDNYKLNISVEQENKLGRILVNAALKTETEIHSDKVDSALEIIFDHLSAGLDSTPYTYQFYVVRNDEINALTMPGANVILYSGLIEFTKSPEELASVIAHEMGHVENRDVITKLAKEIGVSVLLAVILNTNSTVITDISRMIISASFSRAVEEQADQFAFQLMAETGIRPDILASFFMRLKEERGAYDERLEFFMTHPHDNKRIEAALKYPLPPGFEEDAIDLNWDEVREAL